MFWGRSAGDAAGNDWRDGDCHPGPRERGRRALNALVVGAEASRGELRAGLVRAGFTVAEYRDLPTATQIPPLVCIALDHPDQFASDDVARFLAAVAGSRVVCVRSAWCASMLRSRNDWPAAVVVDRDQFEARLEREKEVLQGKRAPLPITAGLEEVAAFNRSARSVLLLLCVATAVCGCGGATPSNGTEVSKPKPAWTEQVRAVRTGASRKIAAAASSKSDWDMLKTDCEALEALELSGEVSPDLDLGLILELPRLNRLKLESGLNDAQAAVVGRHPSLSELLISSDRLTDQGLESLCRLPLVQLRLRAPRVTDAGMAAVGSVKPLRFLHLIDVQVTDAALPELARLESLESLYLDRSKCSDEGLSAFLKQRPDIHFHRDQTHLRDDPKRDGH